MILDKTEIRAATATDAMGISSVVRRAFGRDTEAGLVTALNGDRIETQSWVAVIDGQVIGHVQFSQLEGPERAMALGPLSVDPDWRDFLIGTELVRHALAKLKEEGWQSVFTLGDPVYYGRFGFKTETARNVSCPYQGPYFMALELMPGALAEYAGPVAYPAPFHDIA
jgi:putative acetyltransferase